MYLQPRHLQIHISFVCVIDVPHWTCPEPNVCSLPTHSFKIPSLPAVFPFLAYGHLKMFLVPQSNALESSCDSTLLSYLKHTYQQVFHCTFKIDLEPGCFSVSLLFSSCSVPPPFSTQLLLQPPQGSPSSAFHHCSSLSEPPRRDLS